MGRNKKGKRKTKELIVGSDVDSSDSDSDVAESHPSPAPTEPTKKVDTVSTASDDAPKPAATQKHADPTSDTSTSHVVTVKYCPNCSLPAEFCQFSGVFEKCKPWLFSQSTEDEVAALAEATEQGKKRKETVAQPGNPRKARPRVVNVVVKKRQGKKMMTLIEGLDIFGLSAKNLTLDFKKRFNCGCAVVDEPGKHEVLEVQGNVGDAVKEYLVEKHGIQEDCIKVEVTNKK